MKEVLKWTERIKRTGIKKVVTYHKALNYFLNRFNYNAIRRN